MTTKRQVFSSAGKVAFATSMITHAGLRHSASGEEFVLPGHRVVLGRRRPLKLDSGAELRAFPLAYQGYGTLNPDRSNVILVCHALTGDQFVAEQHPLTGKPGWWSAMVGPGKTIDTDRYYVLCINVLGGCMGSAGPSEINPDTGEPWGLAFPIVTIADMVRAQAMLLDHLGIDKLFAVIGGSMGGMQALEWASLYPERVFAAVPIATAAHHSAQNIAFDEVGRQAVMADPEWCEGEYWRYGKKPVAGPGGGADGGAHHLSVRGEAAREVRPQAAGPGEHQVRLRRGVSGGELSPLPGPIVRRAV